MPREMYNRLMLVFLCFARNQVSVFVRFDRLEESQGAASISQRAQDRLRCLPPLVFFPVTFLKTRTRHHAEHDEYAKADNP